MPQASPKIIPDRDKYRKWYLDSDVVHTLHNGDTLCINAGYRFDAHSVPFLFRWFFPQYDTDIYAALIHDALIDLSPWHRYNRHFMDKEYTILMRRLARPFRAFWMPLAVNVHGYLKWTLWGDYRGQIQANTVITVTVIHDEVVK